MTQPFPSECEAPSTCTIQRNLSNAIVIFGRRKKNNMNKRLPCNLCPPFSFFGHEINVPKSALLCPFCFTRLEAMQRSLFSCPRSLTSFLPKVVFAGKCGLVKWIKAHQNNQSQQRRLQGLSNQGEVGFSLFGLLLNPKPFH